jgi:hypothetical protein
LLSELHSAELLFSLVEHSLLRWRNVQAQLAHCTSTNSEIMTSLWRGITRQNSVMPRNIKLSEKYLCVWTIDLVLE